MRCLDPEEFAVEYGVVRLIDCVVYAVGRHLNGSAGTTETALELAILT